MRAGVLPVVAALLATTLLLDVPADAKTKIRRGVFGTINGKAFKATNNGKNDDPCMFGIYNVANHVITFSAIECKGKRRRQGAAVKKNYKIVTIACNDYLMRGTSTFPFELECPGSAYSETKTGRFRIPISTTIWGANFEILPDFTTTSNLKLRVDAFDGTNIRGAFYGTFEMPLQGNATPPAAVSGEVTFDFPIQVQ